MSRTWDFEVKLIELKKEINENGFEEVVRNVKDPILANKLSVRSNEYWSAKQNGIELSNVFEVNSIEYQGERELLYDDESYHIERTYDKGDYTELVTIHRGDDHHGT